MRARLALGELPAHHAVQDVGARLEPEDRVVELDRPGRARVQLDHLEFHFSSLPSAGARRPRPAFAASCRLGRRRLGRGRLDRRLLGLALRAAAPRPRPRRLPRPPCAPPRAAAAAAERSAAGRITLSGAAFLTASLIVTQPPFDPGTAPLTMISPRSASVRTTCRFCVVTRTAPMCPAIFLPLNTLPGSWHWPIEPWLRWLTDTPWLTRAGRRSCAASCRRRSPCRSRCRRRRRTGRRSSGPR